MIPLADRPTPLARAVLAEATRLFPSRNRASDGILPSREHLRRNPNSDHNDGHAVDVTHDPRNGCDAHTLAEGVRRRCAARQESRVAYVISNGRIASPKSSWSWRQYRGSNKHVTHVHFSLVRGKANDDGPLLRPDGQGQRRTIRRQDRGDDVRFLQRKLGITADGIFGPKTEAAVLAFQEKRGLKADGIVGRRTWAEIDR